MSSQSRVLPQNDLSDARIKAVRHLQAGTVKDAILYLFQCQQSDEREAAESFAKNRVGFSRGTVLWGSQLALNALNGIDWTPWEERKARSIIAIHRKQLEKAGIIPPPEPAALPPVAE